MNVDIKGKTSSTITLNELGIIIRGNASNIKAYPCSIAYNINVETPSQIRELNFLKAKGLIDIVEHKPEVHPDLHVQPKLDIADNKIEGQTTITKKEIIEDAPSPVVVNVKKAVVAKTEITPKNKKSTKKKATKKKTVNVKAEPKKRGRPKKTSSVDELPPNPVKKSPIKTIKRISKSKQDEQARRDEEPTVEISETELDISQKMGQEAVVSMGTSEPVKRRMCRSSIEGSEEIDKQPLNFIDKGESETDNDDAFIESPGDGSKFEDVDFLEI
jgi:hypothetical protein